MRHLKLICENCGVVVVVREGMPVDNFYETHRDCPRPVAMMPPFTPDFVRRLTRGVMRDYNNQHLEYPIHPAAMQGVAKRLARQVYKESRRRGLPHPSQQENTWYRKRRR